MEYLRRPLNQPVTLPTWQRLSGKYLSVKRYLIRKMREMRLMPRQERDEENDMQVYYGPC